MKQLPVGKKANQMAACVETRPEAKATEQWQQMPQPISTYKSDLVICDMLMDLHDVIRANLRKQTQAYITMTLTHHATM